MALERNGTVEKLTLDWTPVQLKDVLKTWTSGQLISMAFEMHKLTYAVEVIFSDSSVSNMEVIKAGKPEEVAAALVG